MQNSLPSYNFFETASARETVLRTCLSHFNFQHFQKKRVCFSKRAFLYTKQIASLIMQLVFQNVCCFRFICKRILLLNRSFSFSCLKSRYPVSSLFRFLWPSQKGNFGGDVNSIKYFGHYVRTYGQVHLFNISPEELIQTATNNKNSVCMSSQFV